MKKVLKSFYYAFGGIIKALSAERNFQIEAALAILAVAAGWFFTISSGEWVALVICMGMVLMAELMNSAIEKLADFVHPQPHSKIGLIKDMAAGAVLLAATASLVVALIIFVPKIISL